MKLPPMPSLPSLQQVKDTLSNVKVPKVKLPSVSGVDLSKCMPSVKMPNVRMPNLANVKAPSLPKINLSKCMPFKEMMKARQEKKEAADAQSEADPTLSSPLGAGARLPEDGFDEIDLGTGVVVITGGDL